MSSSRVAFVIQKIFDMSILRTDTIRMRIIYASVIFVVIPLLVISIIAGYFISSKSESDFLERIDAELIQINSQIESFIEDIYGDLNIIGNLKIFKNAINDKTINIYRNNPVELLNADVKRSPSEREIFNLEKLISVSKPDYDAVIFSSVKGQYITNRPDMKFIRGFDPRSRPYFVDAMAGGGTPSVTSSFTATTGENVVIATKAFPGTDGNLSYVISIPITLKRLTAKINTIKIGKSGYLILLEKNGTVIAHPRKDLLFSNPSDMAPGLAEGLKEGKQTIYYQFEGVKKIARFRVEPNTEWIIVGVITDDEVKTASRYYRILMLLTSLGIAGFCLILYLYISKRILIPIRELTDFGHRIAMGDFNNSISINRKDELGKLADDFNNLMHKLKDSTGSIKAIIEFMPSVIIQLDITGCIIGWNRHAEEFAGHNFESAKGKTLAEIKPELAEILLTAGSFIERGETFSLYNTAFPDTGKKFFNIFIFYLKLEHSGSIVVRIDDITEFINKERQLLQSQKMESLGQLVSGVAHDFNNILGGILGAVSILRLKIKNKNAVIEDFDRNLELAEKSCKDGAAIVEQLLSFSRKDLKIEFNHSDLNNIIEQVSEICRRSFDPCITIKINTFPEESFVMMNDVQIKQVVLNLCINAAHSMTVMKGPADMKGGILEIGIKKVAADPEFKTLHPGLLEKEYYCLYVADTGVGMDNKTISMIFEPFFTTKENTDVKGTGLGLSIVYNIIKVHSGFIDVDSELGKGTIFSIYLPAVIMN